MSAAPLLVTGGTGFLGRPLVAALVERRRRVRLLARRSQGLPEHPLVEPIPGDLLDAASLRQAAEGAEAVVHLAALRASARAHPAALHRVNVEGTRALAEAALGAGAGLFLHVSSALCFGSAAAPGRRESDGHTSNPLGIPYLASRLAALAALRPLAERGLPLVVASPAVVFGPDEPSHPNLLAEEVRRLRTRAWSAFIGGGRAPRSVCHRDDVVSGLLALEEHRPVGRDVILSGEAITPRRFDDEVRARWGNPRRVTFSLPRGAALSVARALDILRGPPGRAGRIESLSRPWVFDDGWAREHLGYRPRGFSAALEDVMAASGRLI